MTTYFSPGVYTEEIPTGPQPISAVSTSVVAIIGSTSRGPVQTPTRITSWSDFQRIFDGNGLAQGYTAESVYGFFENGGPAAYVVRVDPSSAGTWTVVDAAGADAFTVTATSPGAWSDDVVVSVAPDRTSGGAARLFTTIVTAPVDIAAGATKTVNVDSIGDLVVGDKVRLVAKDKAVDAEITGTAVGQLTVTNKSAGEINLEKYHRLAGRIETTATQFKVYGSGIKVGEVLEATAADGSRTTWNVTQVKPDGAALAVTVTAGAPVAGAAFTNRFIRVRGKLPAPRTAVALAAIQLDEDSRYTQTDDDMSETLHAWTSDGVEGTWKASTQTFDFPVPAPAGRLEFQAPLRASLFSEARTWVTPTLEQLAEAYRRVVPKGGKLKLTVGASTAVVKRTDDDFELDSGDLNKTFDTVTYQLPFEADTGVALFSIRPLQIDDWIHFKANAILRVSSVTPVGDNTYLAFFEGKMNLQTSPGKTFSVKAFTATTFAPLRFTLTARRGTTVETYTGLALDPSHPQYFARDGVVNEVSALVTVAERAAAAALPSGTSLPAFAKLANRGADSAPSSAHYKAGVAALEGEPEPSMLICPDLLTFTDPLLQYDLVSALVGHCESFRRFAVLDGPSTHNDSELLNWRNTAVASTYAAVFAPFLQILNLDPTATERYRLVPPSGFVAGVMARTDRSRGVHKAPGNERVTGVVGLAEQYTERRQDLLNPNGINLIRAFPGRGIRIWGARNATDDTIWRYINVRRLFNMMETALDRGTQWVVFEPNTTTTWLRVKASVEGFLDQLWRSGALAGNAADEAFRVRIGLGQTMTEADIDLGLVITEVAVAPAKPAEFVVFRFSQKRLSE